MTLSLLRLPVSAYEIFGHRWLTMLQGEAGQEGEAGRGLGQAAQDDRRPGAPREGWRGRAH